MNFYDRSEKQNYCIVAHKPIMHSLNYMVTPKLHRFVTKRVQPTEEIVACTFLYHNYLPANRPEYPLIQFHYGNKSNIRCLHIT